MIDRTARDRLAEAIKRFISRNSSNFNFDDTAFELNTNDPAVREIRNAMWLLYDDLHEHKLDGKYSLSTAQREVIQRMVIFLESDEEYLWPTVPVWYRVARPFIWLLSLGMLSKKFDRKYNLRTGLSFWPYRPKEALEQARG